MFVGNYKGFIESVVPWPATNVSDNPLKICVNHCNHLVHTNTYTNNDKPWIKSCFYETFLFRATRAFVMQFKGERGQLFGDAVDGDVAGS